MRNPYITPRNMPQRRVFFVLFLEKVPRNGAYAAWKKPRPRGKIHTAAI